MPGAFSSKRNVLFDLDGTLIDSAPAHTRAFVEALAPDHPDLAEKFDYARLAGQPTREALAALGLRDAVELDRLTRHKQQLYRAALRRGEIFVFPGAADLLARLRKDGRALYLVTGASRVSVDLILESTGLGAWFDGTLAAEDAPRGKPAPDPYLAALARHGLAAAASVAIEDGAPGLQSARAAGLDVILVHGENPGVPHARDLGQLATLLLA